MGARKYACGEGRPRNNPPSEEEMELQRERRNLTDRWDYAAAQGNDPAPIDQQRTVAHQALQDALVESRQALQAALVDSRRLNIQSNQNLRNLTADFFSYLNNPAPIDQDRTVALQALQSALVENRLLNIQSNQNLQNLTADFYTHLNDLALIQERSRAFDVLVAAHVQLRRISSGEITQISNQSTQISNQSEQNSHRLGLDYLAHLNDLQPTHQQAFLAPSSAHRVNNPRSAMAAPPHFAAPLPASHHQASITAGAVPSFAGAGPATRSRLNLQEPSLLEEDHLTTLLHSNPHLFTMEMRALRTENQQSAEAMRALRADNDGLARQHLEDLGRIRALEVALQADNDGLARQHLEDLARIRALELELESLRSQHREATGRIHALQTASTSAIRSLEPVQTMVRDHVTCTLCSKEMDELLLCESCGFTHHCTNCENLWGPKRCLKCRSPGETGFWGPVSLAQASQIARAAEQSVEELGGATTTSVSPEIITLLDTDDEEDDVASGGDKESPSPVASGVASGGDKESPKAGPVASGSEEPLSEEEARLLEEAKQASLAEYLRVFDDTSSDEEDVEKTSSDEEDRKPAAKPSVKTEDNYDSDSEFSFGF